MEKKNSNDKKQNKKFDVKEFLTDEKKRARLILLAYFIFFIVLIVAIRGGNTYNEDETARIINHRADEKLMMNNYEFKYTVTKDERKYIYSGKHYNEKELFTYNKNEYYRENEIFMQNKGKDWVKVDNPYVEYEYLKLENLDKILEKSDFDSETHYKDGSVLNKYRMYIDGKITDNLLKITSKKDKLIKIELLFENKTIILEYSNVGNVLDFKI